ncbi:efflux RND transporter permease subunit [Beggiatoa leptomitoformis]|uniref:AcrB/AcrD/AcrF family protein n=1 Tax=Beggiatoa leptomitoformis TaxID=288004 RepID=A0A2N9YHJ1_9GAMM|nr:efflux RND transporter permease subunit [Beggiatoa leptomitoformis]ALG67812.1 AcrB/AcrD/AcrF family protein [Beggiatoa leptomitoformis]AUI69933.1 AcrB/AcrD/AcrF family protein [Beggiatoa leptomitoformis]
MNALIDAAIYNKRVVLLLLAFILISGTSAYINIPKESDPDVAIPIIYVSLSHEGISPEDAERLLVRPIEKELRTIEGVKEMTATAGEGHASVMLEFDAGFNSEQALRDVQQKVDIAKAKLPSETEEPTVNEVNVALFPILVVTLAGDVPERALLRMARQLKDAIESVPSVLEVDITGDREEVLEVIIDPLHVESYNLNYAEVLALFQRNNQLIAAGALDTGQGRFNVKIPGVFETLQDISSLPIKVDGQRVITLGDVAEIHRTFKDPTSYARVNGKPALALEIKKRVGTNIIDTIEQVRSVVEAEKQDFPATVQINFIQDRSTDVRNILADLQNNVLTAVLLVAIVVLAALGLRTATLVVISIPGSFLLGILIIYYLGLTMNIVVLFSLILSSGMLVDGAIVVTEYADRRLMEGMPRAQAYGLAAKRMAIPVITSTLTTLAVFFPLLFWPGVVGEFMKYLPITVIATLSASLIVALLFMPALGALIGKANSTPLPNHDNAPLESIRGITGFYIHVLGFLLKHPLKVLFLALCTLVGTYMLYGAYGKGVEFFPEVEPEQAVVHVRTRGDLSVEERDKLVKEVEARILNMHEFANIYASSGVLSRNDTPEDTIGVIQLELVDWKLRRPAEAIFTEIRQRTKDLAGIVIEVRKPPSGPGDSKPIQLQVSAQYPELLIPATKQIVDKLKTLEGLVDIEDNRPLPGIDWKLLVDREQASRFGADILTVGNGIQLVTNGIKVGEYRPDDADEELDIRVRYPTENRSVDELDQLRISTASGLVPISLFVERQAQAQVGTLKRSDEKRVLTIKSAVAEGVLVNDKLNEIRAGLAEGQADPRIKVTFKGEEEDQRETQAFLGNAFFVAIFLVTLILVAQFNNFYQTGLILSAIIFSTVGVLLGLLITQQPFGVVMCGIGIIALAGIVVNNNIILIDTFNVLRQEGYLLREAILRTCAQRLRPVFLTTFTTILGLIPMVFAINIDFITRDITFGAPSTQWWTQLSTAIAGGLTFATLLTLVLTPCLLMLGQGKKQSVAKIIPVEGVVNHV